MLRILFVCTGNTCRSPMTEAIFRDMVQKASREHDILTISAGVAVWDEMSASGQAIEVMRRKGIDLSAHRSRTLTPELVRAADLILTMTQSHRRAVLAMVPEAEGKVFTLRELAGDEQTDIIDPFGAPVEIYQHCADEIDSKLHAAWEKILQFTQKKAGENASA